MHCRACGAYNPRIDRRCAGCGQRLHRAWWQRRRSGFFSTVSPVSLVILVVGVLIIFGVLIRGPAHRPCGGTPGRTVPPANLTNPPQR